MLFYIIGTLTEGYNGNTSVKVRLKMMTQLDTLNV